MGLNAHLGSTARCKTVIDEHGMFGLDHLYALTNLRN
jgi:hypothetical protein